MDRKIDDIPDRHVWLYDFAKLSWGKIIAILFVICIVSISIALLLAKAIVSHYKH